MITYLTDHFRLPKDFTSLVYLTQLLQSEAMRIGVEHWRRDPACSGVLYWQLNDCWPVASWSSMDYFGRWKAAHYGSQRFYAPLLLSVADSPDQITLFVTNDATTPWAGQLRWSFETLGGERLAGDAVDMRVEPQSTMPVDTLNVVERIGDEQRRQTILVCELWRNDEVVQTVVTPFGPTKHLSLQDPQIGVEVHQDGDRCSIQLQARSLACFVELAVEGVDVVFSDNYFDLPAGRQVSVVCTLPEGWTSLRMQEALRIRSLFDSY